MYVNTHHQQMFFTEKANLKNDCYWEDGENPYQIIPIIGTMCVWEGLSPGNEIVIVIYNTNSQIYHLEQ